MSKLLPSHASMHASDRYCGWKWQSSCLKGHLPCSRCQVSPLVKGQASWCPYVPGCWLLRIWPTWSTLAKTPC